VGSLHHDVFRAVDVGLCVWSLTDRADDRSLLLVEANDAAGRVVRSVRALPALVGLRIDDVLPPARAAGLPSLLATVARTGLPAAQDLIWVTNGEPVEVTVRVSALGQGSVAAVIEDSAEIRRLASRASSSPAEDVLTGLGTRPAFEQEVATRVREEQPSQTLLLLDLDRFRDVNDTLGHRQGDALLVQVAHRLAKSIGPGDLLGRLGGDEFGLLVAGAPADQAAARVGRLFERPFDLGGLSVRMTASVGVAVFPDHATEAAELMRRADVALDSAKRSGRGRAVYRSDDDRYDLRRLRMVTDLREAIRDGSLELHYQPKLDLASGAVVGVEALARWDHPVLGPLAPGEFVPLAEEHGLIGPLTDWVLQESGRQCREWLSAGVDLTVSANISARNLYDPKLVRWLGQALENGGIPAGHLTLELTEGQVATDLPMARQILQRIRAMGVGLSIDDFGTGYSSLAYLSKLPIDELKIDRSFVSELDTESGAAIVQSIIDLGHGLGLHVVAEGVETTAAAEVLADKGCDLIQGNHVSEPRQAADFESWLADSPFAGSAQSL
jgi:diguanylate cyclase